MQAGVKLEIYLQEFRSTSITVLFSKTDCFYLLIYIQQVLISKVLNNESFEQYLFHKEITEKHRMAQHEARLCLISKVRGETLSYQQSVRRDFVLVATCEARRLIYKKHCSSDFNNYRMVQNQKMFISQKALFNFYKNPRRISRCLSVYLQINS